MSTTTADARATGRGPLQRLRGSDPLTALACAVALAVYLPHGFDGYLTRDLGVYTYGGQQAADGVPPYVAILNRAGPLAHLVPGVGALVARLVGVDEVLGMRVLFLLLTVACVGVTYLLGRDLFRSRLAGLAAAAAMLAFRGLITYATYGPREKTAMLLFLLCGLLAMVHRRWGLTGGFIALATLTWQPVFFAAIAGAVVALLLDRSPGKVRALVRLAVGGLVPTAVTVAAYAAVGQLRVLVDDFLLINARYTVQISPLDYPREIWQLMVDGYGWTLWVFLLGTVAQLVLAAVALARFRRRDAATAPLAGLAVLTLVGVLWSLKAFNGWPDVFFMLPCAALGVGGVAAALGRWVPARAALAVTVAWVVVVTGLSAAYSVDARDTTLDEQRRDVAAVVRILPPGARMLSVEAPQPLVLAHERNLSRYQLFGNGLIDYLDDAWPGGREGYARWIAARKPTVIAVGGTRVPSWLVPTLAPAYRLVGESPGWSWYVRWDVGEPTLRELRDTLRDPA